LRPTVSRKCKECGKHFEVPVSEVKRGYGKFCSLSCSATYGNRLRAKKPKRQVELICEQCGKTFMRTEQYIRKMHKYTDFEPRFCSRNCLNASKRVEREVGECLYCGEEFEIIPGKKEKFCSRDCARASINRVRADNAAPTRSLRLRFRVFRRDSFRCQYCGRSPRKDPRVVLEIDHIRPKSAGGSDDIANLTTSCSACNRGKGDLILNRRADHAS